MPTPPEALPVADAAQALGVSVSAIRRGLKSGRYQGTRQATPQGFVWLVEVPDDLAANQVGDGRIPERRVGDDRVGDDRPPRRHQSARRSPATETTDGVPQHRQDTQPGPAAALMAQRAQEMAAFATSLTQPYLAKIESQAERIGRLEERLAVVEGERDAAQARLEALARPAAERANGAVPTGEPERRRWWQRLLFG